MAQGDGGRPPQQQTFAEIVGSFLSRREVLVGGAALPLAALLGDDQAQAQTKAKAGSSLLGFTGVPISREDQLVVPAAYTWQVVNAWGDPLVAGAPAWKPDASQSAADQAKQAGMSHDGMVFFPLPKGSRSSNHGLVVINFEYTDDNLLSPDGMATWTAEKVQKSKNAHGFGVMEVKLEDGAWKTVKDSPYGRRITADTPMRFSGPAAGSAWLKTAADAQGTRVLGTFNNCAAGRTPWGTFLTCEENVSPYFVNESGTIPRLQARYGVPTAKNSWGFRWHEFDERFDAAKHPNEPNRHGWVVETDPFDPTSTPVKRTALGRMAHEGATFAQAKDGRVVFYMGDDDFRSKFEHIYKFVSRRPWVKGTGLAENRDLLDDGVLYAARFKADGTGEWLELVHGKNGLTADKGFASQAEVLIDARTAADLVGATYMDRPEWAAVHPRTGEVYMTLTNNSARGEGKPFGAAETLGGDAANPRAPNPMGHIIRWRERGRDAGATSFSWDVFLQAGDPESEAPTKKGNVKGGVAFAQPDGLAFDSRGVLWILTDSSAQNMGSADWARIGNNQVLGADPATGAVRRFLTGPVGCEISAIEFAPDNRTMFVSIQHPGEPPKPHPARNDPAHPKAISSWPQGEAGGRPRSALVAIRRKDGGIVGA